MADSRFTVTISGPDANWSLYSYDTRYSIRIRDINDRSYYSSYRNGALTLKGAKRKAKRWIKKASANQSRTYDENSLNSR